MDGERQLLEERLAVANRHVTVGRLLLDRHRTNIAEGRLDTHLLGLATQLLAELEESLRLHLEDRNRLRKELAKMSTWATRVQKGNRHAARGLGPGQRTRS